MDIALVVLAAGMGSRYGGLKQLDGVGPSGETILDYAIFDAVRAGFTRVVFVIRRDFETEFRTQIGAKYTGQLRVDYVFQSLDALPEGFSTPAGRTKPWGTGHAVWCAREALDCPFAVINADDFYGRDSFARLGEFLRGVSPNAAPASFAMVGFRMDKTLSENGAVSRGVCGVSADGRLTSVTERTGIQRHEVGTGREFSGEEIVSMNCWGFTPALFPLLDAQLREFLRANGTQEKAEFYLPAAVSAMIAAGQATVQVLPTQSTWFGVTYREDKPHVTAAIGALIASGEYPASLRASSGPASSRS